MKTSRILLLSLLIAVASFIGPKPNTLADDSLKICNIHQEALKKDEVRVIYGAFVFNEGYLKDRKSFFPHSNRVAYGGCIPDPKRLTEEVLYCERCRSAEEEWIKEHPVKDNTRKKHTSK